MGLLTWIGQAIVLAADPSESGGILSNPDIWRVINLLIFVAILVYILRNKIGIGRIFANRSASIKQQLEEARRARREAEERLAEVESRIARLDSEIAEIRAEADREAEREAGRIRRTAAEDAAKIAQTAKREIEGAMKAARGELRAFVAEHSVEMAEDLIRKEIGPDDTERLLARYVDELGEVKK